MGELLQKFLDVTCKCGFLKKLNNSIYFGPMALLLANNITSEWYNESVIKADINMFMFSSNPKTKWQEDCHPSFRQSLQLANEQLPLGLVSVLTDIPLDRNERISDNNLVQSRTNVYRCLRFIDPKKSQQYFYRFQHSRNIWWRKFAREPKIFDIQESRGDDEKEIVHIVVKFPWMTETVETIYNHGSGPLEMYGTMFEVKVGRKRVLPHVIESVCFEMPATVAYLCDAFQPLPARTVLRFHNCLTPYKAAIAIDAVNGDIDELNQLAHLLNLNLRKAGLLTLFSPNKHKDKGVESQFITNDILGIPFTLVVKNETLQNGIAGLRSRDTTLQEQVHISKVTSYLQKLVNN